MNSWYLDLSPEAFAMEAEYRRSELRRSWTRARGFGFGRRRDDAAR